MEGLSHYVTSVISKLIEDIARGLSESLPEQKFKLTEEGVLEVKGEVRIRELDRVTPGSRVLGGVDAASVTLRVARGELAIASGALTLGSRVVIYPGPGVSAPEHPFMGVPLKVSGEGVTNKYIMLGLEYSEDPELPENALSHDVRISLETYLIRKASTSRESSGTAPVLLVDGPVVYPIKHPVEGSKWNAEIARLNLERVRAMREAVEQGLVPVSIVKRVWASSHLTRETGAEASYRNDLEFISSLVSGMSSWRKPTLVGPWKVRESPVRFMSYVIVPQGIYWRTYSIFRVEMLKDAYEALGGEGNFERLASTLAYSALSHGASLPFKLYLTDRVTKQVIRGLTSNIKLLLRSRGITVFVEEVG